MRKVLTRRKYCKSHPLQRKFVDYLTTKSDLDFVEGDARSISTTVFRKLGKYALVASSQPGATGSADDDIAFVKIRCLKWFGACSGPSVRACSILILDDMSRTKIVPWLYAATIAAWFLSASVHYRFLPRCFAMFGSRRMASVYVFSALQPSSHRPFRGSQKSTNRRGGRRRHYDSIESSPPFCTR